MPGGWPTLLRAIALLLLLLAGSTSSAQLITSERDSLRTVLARTTDPRDRLHPLTKMAWSYLFSKEALPYLAELDSLTSSLLHDPDQTERARAQLYRSRLFYQRGYQYKFRRRLAEARKDFGEALRFAELAKDTLAMANAMNAKGVCYAALHMPAQALKWYEAELDLILSTAERPNMYTAHIRQHMADELMRLGRFAEAGEQLDLCDTTDAMNHAPTVLGQAHLAACLGDTTKALALMTKAAAVAARTAQPWDRIAVLEPAARFQLLARHPQQSLTTATTAITLADSIGDHAAKAGCLVIAGQASMELGETRAAERCFLDAMAIAKEHGYIGLSRETGDDGSMVRAAELLRELYREQGRTQEALAITDLWVAWKDSIRTIEDLETVLRLDLERDALTDSIADAARLAEATGDLRAQVQEERQTRQRLMLLGGSVIAVSLLVLTYLLARRKRERILAAHAQERANDEQMIRDLKQRERMSEDLHEELGAGLSALKLWSEMDLADESDPRKRKLLQDRTAMVGELVASLQQIIWAMNSPTGTVKNMVDHLNDSAHLFCAQHALRLRIHVDHAWPSIPLSADQRRLPYLILKEALMNVKKHSGAETVDLSMRWENGLRMFVQDNGKGSNEPVEGLPGNGLRTMKRRVISLGGSIRFDGTSGMRVEVFIPIADGR